MIDDKSLAGMLRVQHQNQLALAAAVEEIALWLETNGGAVTARNVRDALSVLDQNQVTIDAAMSGILGSSG